RLAVLRDVEVDFNRCSGKHGGDALDAVRGQSEEEELYRFRRGFLTLPGARTPRVPRLVQPWLDAILSTVVAGGRRRAAAGTSDEPGWITLMAVRSGRVRDRRHRRAHGATKGYARPAARLPGPSAESLGNDPTEDRQRARARPRATRLSRGGPA